MIKQRANNRSKQIDWKDIVVQHLYKITHGVCMFCNRQIADRDTQIHHIIKIKDGGDDSFDNLRLVHYTCHREHHYRERHIVATIDRLNANNKCQINIIAAF